MEEWMDLVHATKCSPGNSHFLCKSSSFKTEVAFLWVILSVDISWHDCKTRLIFRNSHYMSLQDAGYCADILQIPSVALLTTAGPGSMAATMRLGSKATVSWDHQIYHSNPYQLNQIPLEGLWVFWSLLGNSCFLFPGNHIPSQFRID